MRCIRRGNNEVALEVEAASLQLPWHVELQECSAGWLWETPWTPAAVSNAEQAAGSHKVFLLMAKQEKCETHPNPNDDGPPRYTM